MIQTDGDQKQEGKTGVVGEGRRDQKENRGERGGREQKAKQKLN